MQKKCNFRKPNVGIIVYVAKDLNIDLKECINVEDKEVVAQTGKIVGIN